MKVLEHDKETMTCGACGGTGAGYHVLNNNHGSRDYAEPEDVGPVCLAMNLTRNHCIYYANLIVNREARRLPMHCPIHNKSHRTWESECGRQRLELAVNRAKEVWPEGTTAWLEKFEVLASTSPAGQAARLTAAVLA